MWILGVIAAAFTRGAVDEAAQQQPLLPNAT
jgi:hypothetical protein